MKLLILCILLQVCTPTYEFKSTSSYLRDTKEHLEQQDYSSNRLKPRKVSGIDGWLFWVLWARDHGVPSDASNSDMYDYYAYIQNGGTLSYNDWLNSQSVPLGSPLILLMPAGVYILRKKLRKNKEK